MGSQRQKIRAALGALTGVGAAVLIAGCGGSSSGPSTTTTATTASLARAAYVSSSAVGFKTTMTMDESVGKQNITINANGSFTPSTHDSAMNMTMSLPGSTGVGSSFQMAAVVHGGMMYMKLPATLTSKIPGAKPWLSVSFSQLGKVAGIPGLGSLVNSGSAFNDPGEYLNFLRATSSGSVENLGQETVNGVTTTHYHAVVDLANAVNAEPPAARPAVQELLTMLRKYGANTQMPVDAWIDGSNLIRQIRLSYAVTIQGQSVVENVTEDFSDYGPQPVPTVPSPDETTNLLSVINAASGSTSSSGSISSPGSGSASASGSSSASAAPLLNG